MSNLSLLFVFCLMTVSHTGSVNELTDTSGYIASPGFPVSYPDGLNSTWLISVRYGQIVTLSINVALETCCDRVNIFDGRTISSTQLASLNGSETTMQTFTSTSNHMLIQFTTDGSVSNKGFNASYSTLVIYGYTCNSSEKCAPGLTCSRDVCVCTTSQYYDQTSRTCKNKVSYGYNCNSTDRCLQGFICKGGLCGCNTSQYYEQISRTCRDTLVIDILPKVVEPCLTKKLVVNCSMIDNSVRNGHSIMSIVLSRFNDTRADFDGVLELRMEDVNNFTVTELTKIDMSTVGYGPSHISLTVSDPTKHDATTYKCDVHGNNVLLVTSHEHVSCADTNSDQLNSNNTPSDKGQTKGLHLQVTPDHINEHTERLNIVCSLNTFPNQFSHLTTLEISHSITTDAPEYVDLVIATNIEGSIDLDKIEESLTLSFINNSNQLYLNIGWKFPESNRAGLYKCKATGLDNSEQPVTLSEVVQVFYDVDLASATNINKNKVLEQLKKHRITVEYLSDRKMEILFNILDGLVSKIKNMESTIDTVSKKSIENKKVVTHYSDMLSEYRNLRANISYLNFRNDELSKLYDRLVKDNELNNNNWNEKISNLSVSRYTELVNHFLKYNDTILPKISKDIQNLSTRYEQLQKLTNKETCMNITNCDNKNSVNETKQSDLALFIKVLLPIARNEYFFSSNISDGRRYWLTKDYNSFTTIEEAQRICTFYGGYLAEINTDEEFRFIRDQLLISREDKLLGAMTGATKKGHENVWINPHSGTVLTSPNWGPKEPNNNGGKENCQCFWLDDNKWGMNDFPCVKYKHYIVGFICEIPNS